VHDEYTSTDILTAAAEDIAGSVDDDDDDNISILAL
jgi:hypothetical protein